MQNKINGATFRKMILNGAKLLDKNKDYVDSLNVFPVPDGDTGTNMSLTLFSSAKEVSNLSSNKMKELCTAFAKGALRGARGNSGVISSQIIKGMTDVLSLEEEITVESLAKAFEKGTEIAYKAVTKPKEGTILTVVRAMSEYAMENFDKKEMGVDEFLKDILNAGEEMLRKTPDMLPVLKKAGVVDAGGRGLLIIFEGWLAVLNGEEEVSLSFDDTVEASDEQYSEEAHFDYETLDEITFAYCTEFFIINLHASTTEEDIDRFRDKLMNIGDCVLVIGDTSFVKVHVHTNQPGVALTYALELGELDQLKIENMLEQNRKLIGDKKEEMKPFGIVSVCAGEGLSNIFKDLLVDYVIEGGQTMNPSADDIARACDKINATDVFVLPNNKNIILAAEQAKELSKRNLHIIPSKNVPQGLSAVLAFNPDETTENNKEAMTEALQYVKAGMVTYAVRSTQIDNFNLTEGDIIGIDDKSIVAKGNDVAKVTEELVEKMMSDEISTITLYFGHHIPEEDAAALAAALSDKYPMCDVDYHFGGQPLYYYLVSLE